MSFSARAPQITFFPHHMLHNLGMIKAWAPHSNIIAMIKSNAYGHGLEAVAPYLEGKVGKMGICTLEEAFRLRALGIKTPLLLIQGVFSRAELLEAAQAGFEVVIHDLVHLRWLSQVQCPSPLTCWVKVNTGMGRLGFSLEEGERVYQELSLLSCVQKPLHILSHLACGEEEGHPLNQQQISLFSKWIRDKPGAFSLCNSGGLLNFPQAHFHWVRPGLLLYGASPLKEKPGVSLGLKAAMKFSGKITSIHQREKDSFVGYSAGHQLKESSLVAVVSCGYGDGYPVHGFECRPVGIRGRICQVIGRVSMEMLTVDLTPCPEAQVGDEVIFWGADGVWVEEVAEKSGSSPWRLLTGIQHSRVVYRVDETQ